MHPRTSPTISFSSPLTISTTFINIMIVLLRIRKLTEENKITEGCPKCVNSETGDDRKEWNTKKYKKKREGIRTSMRKEGERRTRQRGSPRRSVPLRVVPPDHHDSHRLHHPYMAANYNGGVRDDSSVSPSVLSRGSIT